MPTIVHDSQKTAALKLLVKAFEYRSNLDRSIPESSIEPDRSCIVAEQSSGCVLAVRTSERTINGLDISRRPPRVGRTQLEMRMNIRYNLHEERGK
jgi:hypothetical protein